MFRIEMKNGYGFNADSVQETLRNFSGESSVSLIIQATTEEEHDILEMEKEINESISEIKALEDGEVIATYTGCKSVISINKALRAGGMYFYDVQLGA